MKLRNLCGVALLGLAACRGDADQAVRARRASQIDPKNAEAHILLGRAVVGTDDFDAAMKQIQEAIDLDPTSASGHTYMGALLLNKGRKADAQAAAEKIAAIAADIEKSAAAGAQKTTESNVKALAGAIKALQALSPNA
jgi:Flp pilus assembly protein TadD